MGNQVSRIDRHHVLISSILAARMPRSSTMALNIGITPFTGTAWLPTQLNPQEHSKRPLSTDLVALRSVWRSSLRRLLPISVQGGLGSQRMAMTSPSLTLQTRETHSPATINHCWLSTFGSTHTTLITGMWGPLTSTTSQIWSIGNSWRATSTLRKWCSSSKIDRWMNHWYKSSVINHKYLEVTVFMNSLRLLMV